MVGTARDLEVRLRVDLVLCKGVVAGHQETRGGVGVAVAKAQRLAVLEHVIQGGQGAVLVHDEVRVVALRAVGVHHLRKDFAVGAVHGFHGRLVAQPGHLHLVEAHGFDEARVVGCKEGIDLQTGLLGHVVQQRLPVGLEVLRGLGRDHAEVDVLGQRARGQTQPDRQGGTQFLEHVENSRERN
ncbi:hypothetical protein D3C71_1381690 [compost metagenome]